VSTGATKSGLTFWSIPLGGLANVLLQNGGLALAVNVSMVADRLGFSYSSQFVELMGLAPFLQMWFSLRFSS
jgi:hypothetical protein